MDLTTVWFLFVGAMFIGYAMLDGFDLGVGVLHLLTRTDAERRITLNSIGPVWDGNEVWFVVGMGALFGAFPHVYAAMLSGFYVPFVLLLVALIFRGVAIEFRSKEHWGWWRSLWDGVFALGSAVPPVVFGIMIGNVIAGLPIGPSHEFTSSSFFALFHWYPLLVGLFVLSLFALHGALYLNLKTEGELQVRAKKWARWCFGVFLVLYLATTGATLFFYPHMIASFQHHWWAWTLVVLTVLAVANVPRSLHKGQEYRALVTSSCVIAGTFGLFGIGMFPTLLRSSLNPAWSLDVYNAASSPGTLKIMLIMAVIGMPFVLAYTLGVYWVFRGKVRKDKLHY